MSALQDLAPADAKLPTKPNHPSKLTPQPVVLDPHVVKFPGAPPVSSLLYSGFIEHLGRCIYGGVVDDPAHPSPDNLLIPQGDYPGSKGKKRLGWRKDVKDVLGRHGDFECPMMRWPGGNFVSNYHWKDAIGPYEDRKKRRELAWNTYESNLFGTDEFIAWCRDLDMEPYLCFNMGTGTLEEALDWLEYCNGTGDSYWANKRREHTGRDEPHEVRIWGLGNEMWGEWQVGHITAAEYGAKANMWAHALRLVDPSIKLVLCGREGSDEWDRRILQDCLGVIDLHSIHLYTVINYRNNPEVKGLEYEVNVFGPAAGERTIKTCQSLIDVANVERLRAGKSSRDVKICFDEWNVWDPVIAKPNEGNEQHYNYTDMLGFCAWLNVLVRSSKDCPVACIAQSVNVIAPIITRPDGMLYQSLYWPFRLFCRFMKDGAVLDMAPFIDTYDGPTHPLWIQHLKVRPSYIDAVAMRVDTANGECSIRLSILNRHPSADWEAVLDLKHFDVEKVEIHEMYSEDLLAVNTWDKPDLLKPTVKTISGKDWAASGAKRTIRKHSWTFFIVDGKAKGL